MDEPRSVSEAVEAAEAVPQLVEPPRKAFAPAEPGDKPAKPAASTPPEPVDLDDLRAWTVPEVRTALKAFAGAADGLAAERVGTSTFMTDAEAQQLAVPLTNIINRNATIRGMASASDAVAAGLALLGITMRNAAEIADTRRERARVEQQERDAQAGAFEPVVIDNPEPLA